MFGLMGMGQSNSDDFLNNFKNELRMRGWKIVVSGITGRAGDNNSINSGADFTLLGISDANNVNYSVVENKTGEEVLLIRGCAIFGSLRKAKESVDALEKLIK